MTDKFITFINLWAFHHVMSMTEATNSHLNKLSTNSFMANWTTYIEFIFSCLYIYPLRMLNHILLLYFSNFNYFFLIGIYSLLVIFVLATQSNSEINLFSIQNNKDENTTKINQTRWHICHELIRHIICQSVLNIKTFSTQRKTLAKSNSHSRFRSEKKKS